MNRNISVFKIISVDFDSLIALLTALFTAGTYTILYMQTGTRTTDDILTILCRDGFVYLLPLWRVLIITLVWKKGFPVQATIVKIKEHLIYTRIDYIFLHNGQEYQVKDRVLNAAWADRFCVGQQVEILAYPGHPRYVVMQEFYS